MIVTQKHFEFNFSKRDERESAIKDFSDHDKEIIRENSSYDPFFTEAHVRCFFCTERLTIPCVMWMGAHGTKDNECQEIWLHRDCAEVLSFRLMDDVNRFKITNLSPWQ